MALVCNYRVSQIRDGYSYITLRRRLPSRRAPLFSFWTKKSPSKAGASGEESADEGKCQRVYNVVTAALVPSASAISTAAACAPLGLLCG